MIVEFESEIWRWEVREQSGWMFVTVPEELSADIRDVPRPPRGFGSVRVRARIGASEWSTSIFGGATEGSYSLPLKKAIRDAESLELGDTVRVRLDVID